MASSRNAGNAQRPLPSSSSSAPAVGKEDDELEEKKLLIPQGCRFHPNDYELILFYLLKKNLGLKLPTNFIQDIDLYQYHPSQIPSGGLHFKKNHSYIFTRLNKETPCRTTPQGHWEASGEEKRIFAGNKMIAFKKKFIFWENYSRRDNKDCWLLYEYRINPDIINELIRNHIINTKVQSWVACKIKYKEGGVLNLLTLESIPEEREDEGDDQSDENADEEEDKIEGDEEEEEEEDEEDET